MAEWTNLFDLGECTVTVNWGDSEAYSGVLGKGESDEFSHWSGDEFTISVSDQGSVTLSADSTSSNNMRVIVSPNYEQQVEGDRVSGVVLRSNTNEGRADSELAGGESYFDTLDPVTPDPLVMADSSGTGGYLSVYAAWGGA